MNDDYYYSGRYAEKQAEAEAQKPVAWITPGGDVSRSLHWCLERCLPDERPRPLYAEPQPFGGEEILVNTAHDVYTLPLQPSGLSSGPRFVVHVPGPEHKAYAGCTIWRGSLRVSMIESGAIELRVDADEAFCDFVQRALDSLADAWKATAQQPTVVDGEIDKARFKKAPCYLCGYNGPGYYQPDTHPCAAKYHTAQQPAAYHNQQEGKR